MFVAVGHDPRSQLVRDASRSTPRATCRSTLPGTDTNLPGVFACGDLVDSTYRQAITAAGTGCAASIDAERWLAENPHTARPVTAPPPTVDSVRPARGRRRSRARGSVDEGSVRARGRRGPGAVLISRL